ncbi:MAG: hypothetical protein ACFFCD_07235 [Promethearchaeota archaeon]
MIKPNGVFLPGKRLWNWIGKHKSIDQINDYLFEVLKQKNTRRAVATILNPELDYKAGLNP